MNSGWFFNSDGLLYEVILLIERKEMWVLM